MFKLTYSPGDLNLIDDVSAAVSPSLFSSWSMATTQIAQTGF